MKYGHPGSSYESLEQDKGGKEQSCGEFEGFYDEVIGPLFNWWLGEVKTKWQVNGVLTPESAPTAVNEQVH